MKSLLVIFVTLFAAIQAAKKLNLELPEWVAFKAQHKKVYGNDEMESKKLQIFLYNKAEINKHNLQFERGLFSYEMKLNEYSDMSHNEFIETMNGFNRTSSISGSSSRELIEATFIESANVELPNFVDWRIMGAVSSVQHQGHCGCCYAFSAAGSLEGQHFRRHGKLVPLSKQSIVDCSAPFGNNGCKGGDMGDSFHYIKVNNGIDTEKSYPYEGRLGRCRYNPANRGAQVAGYVRLPPGDENKLMSAVGTIGPISIAIDASRPSFQHYAKGIYYESTCSSTKLNHAMLVVGYGTENGVDYWLVKNSYGIYWGDGGYIKIPRNKNNHCGIASDPSYPLVPNSITETNPKKKAHITIKIQIRN